MSDNTRPRYAVNLVSNVALALLIYACGLGCVRLVRQPLLAYWSNELHSIAVNDTSSHEIVEYTIPEVVGLDLIPEVKFASLPKPVPLNRLANAYNRPHSLVKPHDDYLGARPHVDTEINFRALMIGCRGGLDSFSLYKNTSHCLEFLKAHERKYTRLPPKGSRASNRDPRQAEYLNADGHNNSLSSYPLPEESQPAFNTSRGRCAGPIIPYHVYWRGPATWRVEMFIKAFLYTQNLACSQLNLWLDCDAFPNAVDDMLSHDPLFARFLPLIERGDIAVRDWRFPSEIPLTRENEWSRTPASDGAIDKRRAQRKDIPLLALLDRRDLDSDRVSLSQKQKTFLPVAVSDAVRFVVLHLFGGGYFDMDVVMLRDMRPFYLPLNHSFAERWSTYTNGGFNTAIMSLTANSSLSAYFLQGATKMGFNFHPLILGIMSQKDGRNRELQMMEHGLFDPLWAKYAGDEQGPCPVPCFQGDYSKAFKGGRGSMRGEWQSYTGPQFERIGVGRPKPSIWETGLHGKASNEHVSRPKYSPPKPIESGIIASSQDPDDELRSDKLQQRDLTNHEAVDADFLVDADIVKQYDMSRDRWPPKNRTLENFFRGSYTYHIHNQWNSRPEPNSWLNVIENAHDRFFAGEAPNPYGEMWTGPPISAYRTSVEFL